MLENLPEHLSYSSISMFTKCPERWWNAYMNKEKEPPDSAMTIGSVFHLCMEENFKHKLKTGIDLSSRRIEEFYNYSFERKLRETPDLKDPEAMRSSVWRLIEQYHREIAPTITPKEVEKKLEMDLPGKKIKKLIGFIDLITTKDLVIDYKSSAWTWPEAQVNTSLQPTTYGLLLGAKKLDFEYHLIIKSDAIRQDKFGDGIVFKRTHRSEKDMKWLWSLILKMINILESPDPYSLIVPSPSNACMNCFSRKTCGYRSRG